MGTVPESDSVAGLPSSERGVKPADNFCNTEALDPHAFEARAAARDKLDTRPRQVQRAGQYLRKSVVGGSTKRRGGHSDKERAVTDARERRAPGAWNHADAEDSAG